MILPVCFAESETVHHLLLCGGKKSLEVISEVLGTGMGRDYESVARLCFVIRDMVWLMLSLQHFVGVFEN
jgi:hypothetical protein